MAYTINFLGHCQEDSHDKVWGFMTTSDGRLYNFWGRRGKKFTFQQQPQGWSVSLHLHRKAEEKCRAGRKNGTYRELTLPQMEAVWPTFVRDLEHQLIYARLANNFRFGAEED